MPDNLLFATSPILWYGGFPWNSLLIASGISGVFTVYILWHRYRKHWKKIRFYNRPTDKTLLIPEIHDPDFVWRAMNALRDIAMIRFVPANARAHTQKDILKYCDDPQFLNYWTILENTHYNTRKLPAEKRLAIRNFLLSYNP